MIVKQEIISKIRDYFDLNIYETKAWLALLSKGIASAGNIATLSGVPRSRTYDVLESLEKKGFAIVKMGKPVKYLGVKPRMVLEKLKNNVKKHAEDKIKDLSNIRDTSEFLKLQEIYDQGIEPVKKEDILSALKGRANISNYLKEILQEAKREVMICMNAEELMNKSKLFTETFDILPLNVPPSILFKKQLPNDVVAVIVSVNVPLPYWADVDCSPYPIPNTINPET